MKKAFTLVEMLVAVVLLTLLIGVALFSFRLQLMTVRKIKLDSMQRVLAYTQMKRSIESMKYYLVQEYDTVGRPIDYAWDYLFDGTQKKLLFVTENPIFTQGDALVALECKEKKLLYTEEPLYGNIDFLRPSFTDDSIEKTLYDNLEVCRFSYVTMQGRKVEVLKGVLPSTVFVTLSNKRFVMRVKSDDNLTKTRLMDRLYDTDL